MWPNIFAPSFFTVAGITLSHLKLRKLHDARHAEIMHHITKGSHMSVSAQGEDRSDFQSVFPWTGFDFGFAKATEGLTWTGKTFAANWAELAREGKPRGAYHFLHPDLDPAAQARHFVGFIQASGGLRPGDMLVSDCEVFDGLAGAQADAANKAFLDEVCKLVDKARHPVLTYTNEFVGQHLARTAAAYPELWFAHPSNTSPSAAQIAPFKAWRFWQWGIIANIDRNAFNGSADALKAWVATYASPQRKTVIITTDGARSLLDICQAHANSPLKVIARTLLHGPHPRLVAYTTIHPMFRARMPSGIRLWVRETA